MKPSKYNVFQEYEGAILAFNSFSDSYLVLDDVLYQLYKAAVAGNDLQGLQDIHPDFYESMTDLGFFVPAAEDELEKVKALRTAIDYDDRHFRLIINPTMNCNFKCWYCYETHIKDSKMAPETIEHAIRFVDNVVTKRKIKSLQISWFGGEPLLYYDKVVLPVLTYTTNLCKENDVQFGSDFTTNGYLLKEEMMEQFRQYNVTGLQITLDGAREQHDKIRYVSSTRGSYREIINNIIMLCRHQIRVMLRINYTAETLVGIDEILEDLSVIEEADRTQLAISFHQVWQTKKENDLKSEIFDVERRFRSKGFVVDGKQGSGIAASCYADHLNEAVINYNGEVFKCTARDFTTNNREGVLNENGEIEWNDVMSKRMEAKLTNKPCQVCPILPICGGGCSQKALENIGKDYCVYNFDENEKKRVVKYRFMSRMELAQ